MAIFALILVALGGVALVVVRDGRAAVVGFGAQWLGLVLVSAGLGATPGNLTPGRESIIEFLTATVCIAILWLTLRGLHINSSDESNIQSIHFAQDDNTKSKIQWAEYMLPAVTVLLGGLAGVGFASIFPLGAPESDLAFYWIAISGLLALTLDGARSLTKLALGLLTLLNATALLMYMLGLPPLGVVPLGLMAIMRVGAALVLAYGLSLSMSLFGRLGLGELSNGVDAEKIDSPQAQTTKQTPYITGAILIAAGLLAWSLLTDDGIVAVLGLFGVALMVAVVAGLPLAMGHSSDPKRLTGGLKHLSMAVVATTMLVAGGLALARFPLNPENTGTLQIGLGLLAVGLIVRAGAVPFAAGSMDLAASAPTAAMLALGAACPVVIIAGLRLFGGLGSGSLGMGTTWTGRDAALWIAAAGALLAGLRALANGPAREDENDTTGRQSALLATSAVALQVSWALFGVFSGTNSGALGATLLAANIALSVPLIVHRPSSIVHHPDFGLFSLLGLPPLGGFVGVMLVAQAAAEVGGAWLWALLLGSVLVAIGWLRTVGRFRFGPTRDPVVWALVGAQFVWFGVSLFLALER